MPLRRRYYTHWRSKRQVLESGDKPSGLASGSPPQRAWARCLNERELINPIHVARRFERQYRTPGSDSYAAVAEYFGVSRPTVCYYLSLLHRLPTDFVQWLESRFDRPALGYFTERRLRPITRIASHDARQRRLQVAINEFRYRTDVEADQP